MRSFRILCVALMIAVGSVWGAELPPEKGVTLDFAWLSPPLIAPDSAWGNIVRMNEFVRLSSRPGTAQPSYSWTLRYPISINEYPVLVMKYRASTLGLASEPLLSVELTQGGGVPVIAAAELQQNGTVQEIRKDLGQLAPGAAIGRLRFVLPPAVAHLDVLELRFECGSDMPAAKVPMRQKVDFAVVDEYNRPMADAEVRAGPLERKNWTTVARTGTDGRVSLAVISPADPGEVSGMLGLVQPTEAAIMRRGYAPQYLSSIDLGRSELIAARLTRGGQLPAAEPSAITQQPGEQVEQTTVAQPPLEGPNYIDNNNYYDNYRDRYDHRYGGGYYPFGYSPGFVVVVVNAKDLDGKGNGDGQNNGGANGPPDKKKDLRTPPLPLPTEPVRAVPWQGQTSVATQGVTTVARYGVSTVAGYGVTRVPRYGVTTVPRYGVVTAPSQGIVTAPTQGVVAAPIQGITTVPKGPTFSPPLRAQSPLRSVTMPAPNRTIERSPIRTSAPRSSFSAPAPRQSFSRPSRAAPSRQAAVASPRSFSRSAPSVARSPSRVQLAAPTPSTPAPPMRTR